MEAQVTEDRGLLRTFARGVLGGLDAAAAETLAAATGDVALVLDRDGVICDLAFSNEDMIREGAGAWLDRRWGETVSLDSRAKVDEMLHDARASGATRWREINQVTSTQKSMALRYVAVDAGRDGRVIAIGRDERATALMQQRLIEAQQAMERDYARLRDADFRYRLLFQMSGEAVLVVDGTTRRIVEINPAAQRLVGDLKTNGVGESFAKLFDMESQDAAAALLSSAQSTARTDGAQGQLVAKGRVFQAVASLFRHDRAVQCLVRLTPLIEDAAAGGGDPTSRLQSVLERIPDPFVLTDESFDILTANTAFLDLARIGTSEQAKSLSLDQFLGRTGIRRNVLIDNLRAHGSVRNFGATLYNSLGEREEVEVSAVLAPEGEKVLYGFTLRSIGPRRATQVSRAPELQNSVQQLTELVGRVTLKELVRETTDMVERLCIEAALELTRDNRASAAEILGLSRQSLYSKLHRFGLGNLSAAES